MVPLKKSKVGKTDPLKRKTKTKTKKKRVRRRAQKVIKHYPKLIALGLVVALLFSEGIFAPLTLAATYTFTQTQWDTTGATATEASHNTDQSGWTRYSAKDATTTIANITGNVGDNVQIVGTASSTTQTNDTDFNAGSKTNVVVSGSGSGANLIMSTVTAADTWVTLQSSPSGGLGGPVLRNGSDDSIYVTQHGGTGFYKYSISGNSWTTLSPTVGFYGGVMVRNGSDNDIYVIPAWGATGFYKYSISGNSWTTLSSAPGGVSGGSSMIRNGSDDYIYLTQGNSNTGFYRYSISGNSWTTLAVTPGAINSGSKMIRNSSDNDIYLVQGNGSTGFYKYSISGDSWTTLTAVPNTVNTGSTALRDSSSNDIYLVQGSGGTNFYKYSISGNSWSTLTAIPGAVYYSDVSAVHNASSNDIYVVQTWWGGTSALYKYSISGNSWTTLTAPPGITTGGSVVFRNSSDNNIYLTQGDDSTGLYTYSIAATYQTSGTFTSVPMDMGQVSAPSTVNYTATTPSGTSISVDVCGNTDNATWTNCVTNVANGGSIAALSGSRYLRYQVSFTGDGLGTPTLSDVTLNFSNYTNTQSVTLTSSKYDTTSAENLITKVSWVGTGTSASELIKVQVRSASSASGLDSAPWCGASDTGTCTGSNYFLEANNGVAIPDTNPLRNGGDDQYLQYKVTLTSGGTATPSLNSIVVQYVVNAPPEFDATYGTNGVTVSQSSTTDATWGKVLINYKVRDPDATSGSATPGYITPSFEYNIGGGWVAITSQYLEASDVSNKVVTEAEYNTYSATWDAISQLGTNVYASGAQIRVRANDNEAANNTGTAASAAFPLDTKIPAVSSFSIDGSDAAATVVIAASDDSQIQDYEISNNADFSADGANAQSGSWQTVGATSLNLSIPWTLIGTTTSSTVYFKTRDIYGSTVSTSAVAPVASPSIEVRDLSTPSSDIYREFLTWGLYTSVSGATFSKYEIYRSTNGSSYSLLTNVTDSSTNYYIDVTVSSTTMAYYKIRTVDTDTDRSAYTTVVSDLPDGKGGTDLIAPSISSVTIDTVKNTSARVTWTTDELANGSVDFGTSLSYGSIASSSAYGLTHSAYVTGLTPNTLYYVRVNSVDIAENTATNDNSGAGYTFTTVGGPVITSVVVNVISDKAASVVWNTSTTSNSYVDYSISSNLAGATEVGSATQTSGQHQVDITGLSAGNTYYFQVESTDGDGNTSIDTNNGQYYSFTTTVDTTAPVISSVGSPVQGSNAAVITWQTDELATSQVEYGIIASTTEGNYTSMTVVASTPTIFHVVTLSPETNTTEGSTNTLEPTTTYYFRVRSSDPAGNAAASNEYQLATNQNGVVVIQGGGGGGGGSQLVDTTPPVISNIVVGTTTPFGATISFETNKNTRGVVNYTNIPGSYNGSSASDLVLSSSHTINITGLHLGTTYTFKVTAIDKSGNVGESAEKTFKTQLLAEDLGGLKLLENSNSTDIQDKIENLITSALPSLNPPFIANTLLASTTEDGTTVTWDTNVPAYGAINYATDDEYAKEKTYTLIASEGDIKTTNHQVVLTGLMPNTTYHFAIRSFVFQQIPATTEDVTFTTKAPSVQAQALEVTKKSFHAVWTTGPKTNSIVEYRKMGTVEYNKKVDPKLTTAHDVFIENLDPVSTYEVKVSGITAEGNVIGAKQALVLTTGKEIPPAVSGLKVNSALVPGGANRIQTIVSWDTDEPAMSAVYYEEGSGSSDKALANKEEDTTMTKKHAVILTSLKPGTVYRFQIESVDDSGNRTILPIRTIITPSQSQSIVDVIFKNFSDTFNFIR